MASRTESWFSWYDLSRPVGRLKPEGVDALIVRNEHVTQLFMLFFKTDGVLKIYEIYSACGRRKPARADSLESKTPFYWTIRSPSAFGCATDYGQIEILEPVACSDQRREFENRCNISTC